MRSFRYFLFALAGFLPCATGCEEMAKATAKANETSKTGTTAPADSESAKKPRYPGFDLDDFPTTDPVIENAVRTRDRLAEQEEDLLDRLDDLRTRLASAKADPARVRQSIDEFLSLTRDLRDVAADAGKSIDAMIATADELARSSKYLADSYRASAELFRKKARDYSEKRLRDQLLAFAADHERIARSSPERTRMLESFRRKLPRLKSKVRESVAFLDDVTLYLESQPGVGRDARDRYAGQFESFAATFSQWIVTLEELREGLRERAVSHTIQEGYRVELVARQKAEETKREELARLERMRQSEIARVEQVRKDEEARLARLKEDEIRKATAERLAAEHLAAETRDKEIAKAAAVAPASPVVATSGSPNGDPTVSCVINACPPTTVCVRSQPCRIRLFPLFRRCP